jgi:hypothetical protein
MGGEPPRRRSPRLTMESSGATPEVPKPPPEVESAVLLGHIDEAVSLYVLHTDIDEETARKLVAQLAEEL